jgi:protein involved in polysaccharide export with SLBB domain
MYQASRIAIILLSISPIALVGCQVANNEQHVLSRAQPARCEFYIGGHVVNPGVYGIPASGGALALAQAIKRAGYDKPLRNCKVVIRNESTKYRLDATYVTMADILDGKHVATQIHPFDVILVDVNSATMKCF